MTVINFLVAILLGSLIGLQREYEQQHTHIIRFAGLRTFILITFLGAILGYISHEVIGNYSLVTIGFIAVILLAILSYYLTYLKYKDNTATTEISAVLAYILGLMCVIGFMNLAVIFGILITGFLTFKKVMHNLAAKIKKEELFAMVEFALISLVVLPFLPNKNYSPLDVPILKDILLSTPLNQAILQQLNVFNLYYMWLMVIFVAGISFLGYLFVKFLGTEKGYGLIGFFGGLVSSTAVTLSVSGESKKHNRILFPFVLAVIIASSTTFIRMIIEVSAINSSLLNMLLIPLGLMAITGYIAAFILYIKGGKSKEVKEIKFKQPFTIGSSIKFGLFFAFILFIAKLAQVLAGSVGIYFASILSGIADVDAITLTMSSLSKAGEISAKVAVTSIILAASSNTLVKAGIAWFLGEKRFARYVLIISILILTIGLGTLFFI